MRGDITRSGLTRTMASALAGLSAAVAVHAQNRIVYVDASAPAGGNGQSWQTAYNDLQLALLLVHRTNTPTSKTEFRIAAGIYRPDLGLGNREFPFFVEQADQLVGGYAGRSATDPNDIDATKHRTVLSGDLLQNDGPQFSGRADNSFSLIQIGHSGAGLTSATSLDTIFRNLELSGCAGESSFSLIRATQNDRVVLSRCMVRDNHYSSLSDSKAIAKLAGTQFSDNQVHSTLLDGVGEIHHSRIIGNRSAASSAGALIFVAGAVQSAVIANTLIADNRTFSGVIVSNRPARIVRCTVAGCDTTFNLMFLGGTSSSISNCIFAENRRTDGLSVDVFLLCSPSTRVGLNVFARGSQELSSPGCSFSVTQITDVHPFVDRDGPDNNPDTWADNDYRPRPNGLAIDRADFTGPGDAYVNALDVDFGTPFDVFGVPNLGRGASTFADLGAVEFRPLPQDSSCPADFNRSGTVTVQDVFDYLTAYFGGCM